MKIYNHNIQPSIIQKTSFKASENESVKTDKKNNDKLELSNTENEFTEVPAFINALENLINNLLNNFNPKIDNNKKTETKKEKENIKLHEARVKASCCSLLLGPFATFYYITEKPNKIKSDDMDKAKKIEEFEKLKKEKIKASLITAMAWFVAGLPALIPTIYFKFVEDPQKPLF